VARGATSRPRSRRPLAWAVAAALVFVIAGVAVWQTTKPPPAPAPEVVAQPKNPILALPTGPSIAVMPFENLSDSSSDDYFAAGLAGDISIQLSYEPNFRIIGRSATQKYRGQTIDVRAIAAELGVTYMLLGSVRRTEDTIRVTAELLEGSDGSQIWAEIFDRQLTADNLFTVQDEIAGRVVGTISDETGVTPRPMRKRAVARNAFSVSSYECVLLGHEFQEKHTQESHALARDCLEKAVRDDPEYADAWGMLSIIYGQEAVNGFNPLPNSLERSLEAGLRGVQANDNSQMAWWGLTAAYYWTHQLEKFIHAAERAVSINPNDVSTLSSVGFTYGMWGMYDKGLPLLEKAIALSPFDVWWYYAPFWMEAFARDDYNAALEYLYKYELPGFQWTYIYFAATYGHLGQTEKAREAVDQLLELRPDIANKIRQECRFWNFPEPVIAKIVDGLRKAGLDIPDEPDTTD